MATDSVLLKHVAPAMGCLVAWAMFLAPLRAVLQVRRSRALGALNPLPLVAMWANCAAWLGYAYLTRDPYVLASNEPGLILAAFMTVTCYGFADERARDTMLGTLLGFSALLSVAAAAVCFSGLSHAGAVSAWGFVTVGVLLVFYAAPLSSVAEVLRTRSSAALNEPLALMAVLNGGLWSAYGWAVADPFIWAPNVVGAVFGCFQVSLCRTYPSKPGGGGGMLPSTMMMGGQRGGGGGDDDEGAAMMRELSDVGGGGKGVGVGGGGSGDGGSSMGARSFSFPRSARV